MAIRESMRRWAPREASERHVGGSSHEVELRSTVVSSPWSVHGPRKRQRREVATGRLLAQQQHGE